ncbi:MULTISPECIES: efflux RND transporter permease subunit [Cellulophaga]|uniref:Acriflavin resistance protein n=1 Tax=Cellulophaga lytica (strain ATCC 23178 / DSM 7489 / JCM 8516 / NBRC 14961 / NCIMB 1423 / VKM B-1433 / Cy l20) TaxID=867900 RepID=F0RAU6_CELLC|nr:MULTISPECIES: efflux RND transporter permease subunit [Cellulophaga]ADY29502.1 acriflavin resistance protein [Cellulophaga lytica DSM 7489]APU10384.1 copper transporter [Cellulophaga lytica]TVZ07951.1 multidrug efflux pump subunit AcrB [Cellulophaga sp. RHA_52]WQG76324.1 efflux RND transporter permease subunit [Cellulophaga lytica]
MSKIQKNADKEFKISSWAIDNPSVIYVLIGLFLWIGLSAYMAMPREDFPEVIETKIYISTPYPGNTAEDIERLITDPLEDKIKNVSNVVEVTSTSQEDYAMIIVEFDEGITVQEAKQKIKDEVDAEKASEDWPTFNGAKVEPNVFDLNLSEEMPIMNINFTGDYPVEKLKDFAEYLQDKVEDLQEIKQADIRGAQEKEVEIAVDIYKMMAAKISFDDVLNTIRGGNVTMSAGNLKTKEQRRTIRILGEVKDPQLLNNFVVKSENGATYLRDIATITFSEEDKTTYAREFGESVVMLDVKKRAGQNSISASDQIKEIVKKAQKEYYPPDLKISIANDSSTKTLNQVDDLVNNIIFGIILVVTVLMFFLGFRNALFVGFAIPMSMFMSFMILSLLGYTLNTMILFGMIMGLGMLVDNGIVVVENVYRLMDEGLSKVEAAKKGVGEIAFPIIVSTLTTVAAFVPLGLWPGVMGQFMKFFPITLSVVLGSSLLVAILMNSMLVSRFMELGEKELTVKQLIRLSIILGGFGLLILIFGGAMRGLGSVMIITAIMFWAYKYFIKKLAIRFQKNTMVKFENWYERRLKHALRGGNVYWYVGVTFVLLLVVFMLFGMSIGSKRTKIEFFPDNIPNEISVYIEYPEGTSIEKTNAITKVIEKRVYDLLDDDIYKHNGENFIVDSAVSQVGEGAGNPQTDGGSTAEMPHKGKITVNFSEFKFRRGINTEDIRAKVQKALSGIYPGVNISVEKDSNGPPAGYPINIELEGKDYNELIATAESIKNFINTKNIAGIEEIKIDVNKSKPSMEVVVDREKAGELGVSVAQVGNQLRRALFGEKAGVYKEDGDDYDINVRFNEDLRYNTNALFNQNIIFRDPSNGQIKEIPVSAVATTKNTSGFSAIKHRDNERVVTIYSGLEPGFTDAAAIVDEIQKEMEDYKGKPSTVKIDYTGQIEEQNKQMIFLVSAFFSGLGLIMLILIFQFGGISKPIIIMIAIFLSFIGVFGGLMITGWSFVIMMTMMGIISLAGIVVNNGVVLLDYTQILIDRKKVKLGLDEGDVLSRAEATEAIVTGGKARLRPVILTAVTTVLGLIPLAIGLNIDFFALFSEFNPHIYIGGDNVIFWGPLAWTVIFGLIVATFLTLIIVPALFDITYRLKIRFSKKTEETKISAE